MHRGSVSEDLARDIRRLEKGLEERAPGHVFADEAWKLYNAVCTVMAFAEPNGMTVDMTYDNHSETWDIMLLSHGTVDYEVKKQPNLIAALEAMIQRITE